MAPQPPRRRGAGWLIVAFALGITATASAKPEAVAFRIGNNAWTVPGSFDYQALALRFRLPWQGSYSRWDITTHLDVGAGAIESDGRHVGLFSIGPSVSFGRGEWRIELGTAPSVFTRNRLSGRNFGGWFQFTSHVGLYWQIDRRWRIGYRLQHTSNGRLYSENDGLDLQTLDVWVGF